MKTFKVGVIYCIQNLVNGKEYVGQTVKTSAQRWKEHVSLAAAGARTPLHCAIRKYGAQNFKLFVVLAYTEPLLDASERVVIKDRRTLASSGYNLTAGGYDGVRCKSVGKKIGAAHLGMKRSAETCARISAANKGKHLSTAYKVALSMAQLERFNDAPTSLVTRLKIAGSLKGRTKSYATRQRMSAAQQLLHSDSRYVARLSTARRIYLQTHSDESAKFAAGFHAGYLHTAASKQLMSDNNYWMQPKTAEELRQFKQKCSIAGRRRWAGVSKVERRKRMLKAWSTRRAKAELII